MTLPTSRQRPWIFPDQRAHMESLNDTVYQPRTHTPEMIESNDPWHRAKCEAEHNRVFASLHDNHKKDKYYVANPNKNWGTLELHHTSRHSKHPERLHGGVMTSKAGQQWGFNRLKERVNELNIRASSAFGAEANMAQPSKLPGKTGAEDAINMAFSQLYDSVQAFELANLANNARKILEALYEGGDTLGSNRIAAYTRDALDLKRDMLRTLDQPYYTLNDEFGQNKKRVIKSTLPTMDRILRLLDLLAKTANLGAAERKLAIQSTKGADLAEARIRFGATEAFTAPSLYQTGLPQPSVPGQNPPGQAELNVFQGQRNLPASVPLTAEEEARYESGGVPPEAGAVSPSSSIFAGSPRGSEVGSEAFGNDWVEGTTKKGKRSLYINLGKGGCNSCPKARARRALEFAHSHHSHHRHGAGPGDGPMDSTGAKQAFFDENKRYPQSDEELLKWMKAKNAGSMMVANDPTLAAELPPGKLDQLNPPVTAEEKQRFIADNNGQPPRSEDELYKWVVSVRAKAVGHGKHHVRRGRGAPRDTEASRLLKMLNDIEDKYYSSEGKKKKL
jgi:hypothetical protein